MSSFSFFSTQGGGVHDTIFSVFVGDSFCVWGDFIQFIVKNHPTH
jgi:hypothetical protein